MKISDIEVIEFRTWKTGHGTRWGYGVEGKRRPSRNAITKISTDDGAAGYALGGNRDAMEQLVKPLLLGEDPLDREKLWNWLDQLTSRGPKLAERDMGLVDCALWDLAGRVTGLPINKLLGGARDKVKAYASTAPNLGPPEVYVEHALACKQRGYKAYKIHAYICWNPHTAQPAPQLPGFPREDLEVCRAVREAVGDDMVLMLDPYGVYTLEEALWVGRELEKLNFYWLEHPMIETRMEPYRRLARELSIAICSPEHAPGGLFSRAEWLLQGAADMLRTDIYYGGITGCWKLMNVCQAFGLQCELHMSGWAHAQLLGAAPASTCEYYERGLLSPGKDDPQAVPYLRGIPDPLDDDGNVVISQRPGLGLDIDWDYIAEHRIERDE